MRKITKIFIIPIFILLLAAAAPPISARNFGNGAVRVLHASPDAPAVDILVNDQEELADVEFGDISEYQPLARGEYNFKVTPANDTQTVVIDADAKVRSMRYYTVIAANYLSDIEPIIVQDRNRYIPWRFSQVQVNHLVPDAPAVDLTTSDGTVLISDLSFKDTEYVRVAAGTYDLELRVAGTDQVVYQIPDVELDRGTTYSAYALGTLDEADDAEFQVSLVKSFSNFDRLSFFRN